MATATEQAISRLRTMKKGGSTNTGLIADYLEKRCTADAGFAEDVLREDKTLSGCMNYIMGKARRLAVKGCAMVEDHIVFEWSEDYFRSGLTGAELEKKVSGIKVERPKGIDKPTKKAEAVKEKPVVKVTQAAKVKEKKNDDIPGQLDIFSLLGGAT